jgi:peptide/nickel transport system permease protein
MRTTSDRQDAETTKVVVDSPEAPRQVIAIGAVVPERADTVARSQWQLVLRRFLRHRVALIALITIVAFYLIVLFAKQTAPEVLNPKVLLLHRANQGPSLAHWFGTDELGHDQTTRIMYAARLSMTIGLLVALVSTFIGVLIGAMAGYFGSWIDQLLMRITDLFLIVPGVAILAMAQKGLSHKKFPLVGQISSSTLIISIMALLFWQPIARVVRGLFLSLKEKEFVEAARASGASSWRIMFRHIVPNIIGPIAVNTTLIVGYAILLESTLSFLGFGVEPPAVSLGAMLSQSESAVGTPQAYLIYFPGLALLLIVLCVNFLGDGLRDAFDPQSVH